MDRFQEMEIFADVVSRKSFSATARARALSPSGVSKLVLRLERRLGILLFKRDTRQVSLTEEGQRYYLGVQRVLASMADLDAQNDLETKSDIHGHLHVMCSLPIMTKLLAPFIREFSRIYPELKMQFSMTQCGPLHSLDPTVDLGFYSADMPSSSLIARKIFKTGHVICASPAYLDLAGVPLVPDDLAHHHCHNLSMDAMCNHWPVHIANGDIVRLDIESHFSADNSETLYALVLAGAGIGRFPLFQVQHDIEQGRLVRILDDYNAQSTQAIYAVYHSRRFLSRRIQVFLDFIEHKLAARAGIEMSRSVRLVASRDDLGGTAAVNH